MTATSALSLQGLATLARREGGPPPAQVAQEFESLLIGEMLRPATKPLFGDGLLDGGSAGRMYREQFFQEVARLVASRGSFGLAPAIERELTGGASVEAALPEPGTPRALERAS